MFDPLKRQFFHWKLLLDDSVKFHVIKDEDLCQKWKVKLIFRGAYRLSGTGIVECLKIIDVGWTLKQFDGLIWLTLTPPPRILRQIYATDHEANPHCQQRSWIVIRKCSLNVMFLRCRRLIGWLPHWRQSRGGGQRGSCPHLQTREGKRYQMSPISQS